MTCGPSEEFVIIFFNCKPFLAVSDVIVVTLTSAVVSIFSKTGFGRN